MKSAAKLFYGLTVFLGVMTVVYIFGTMYLQDTGSVINENQGRLEWAGATGLFMSTLLTDITPSDWEEAGFADGAGTLGVFSAASIWPFVMCCALLLLGYGIAFWLYWLIALGAILMIWATTRLNTQYVTPHD